MNILLQKRNVHTTQENILCISDVRNRSTNDEVDSVKCVDSVIRLWRLSPLRKMARKRGLVPEYVPE